MIKTFINWVKSLFSHKPHKIPRTEKEFKEIERRLDSGENVSIPELAYLLRYLSEKDRKK